VIRECFLLLTLESLPNHGHFDQLLVAARIDMFQLGNIQQRPRPNETKIVRACVRLTCSGVSPISLTSSREACPRISKRLIAPVFALRQNSNIGALYGTS
jgi:hypothetical protein